MRLEPIANGNSMPCKRVLVIRYSQSGQLSHVIERLIAPLREDPAIAVCRNAVA